MARRTWISASGDASATASWSGGVVPVAGDVVIFEPNGSVAPTAGLNFAGVYFDTIFISEGFDKPIGSHTNPWISEATVLTHHGDCPLFYKTSDPVGSNFTRYVTVDSPYQKGSAATFSSDGVSLFWDLNIIRGHVDWTGDVQFLRATIGTLNAAQTRKRASLKIGYSASAIPDTITLNSGMVESHIGAIGTGPRYIINGGTWHQVEGGLDAVVLRDGSLIYDAASNLTTLFLDGGTADFSGRNVSRTITHVIQTGGELIHGSGTTITNYRDTRERRRPK